MVGPVGAGLTTAPPAGLTAHLCTLIWCTRLCACDTGKPTLTTAGGNMIFSVENGKAVGYKVLLAPCPLPCAAGPVRCLLPASACAVARNRHDVCAALSTARTHTNERPRWRNADALTAPAATVPATTTVHLHHTAVFAATACLLRPPCAARPMKRTGNWGIESNIGPLHLARAPTFRPRSV